MCKDAIKILSKVLKGMIPGVGGPYTQAIRRAQVTGEGRCCKGKTVEWSKFLRRI